MDDLQSYLDSVRQAPFQWGEHDCALFAAKWMDVKFGTAMADAVRSFGVRSAKDYRGLQRRGKSIEALTKEVLGAPVDSQPERGDVVLIRGRKGLALGIASPPVILCAGEIGIEPVPLSCSVLVWRPSCHR